MSSTFICQGWTDIDAQRLAVKNDEEYRKERAVGYSLISRQVKSTLLIFNIGVCFSSNFSLKLVNSFLNSYNWRIVG